MRMPVFQLLPVLGLMHEYHECLWRTHQCMNELEYTQCTFVSVYCLKIHYMTDHMILVNNTITCHTQY